MRAFNRVLTIRMPKDRNSLHKVRAISIPPFVPLNYTFRRKTSVKSSIRQQTRYDYRDERAEIAAFLFTSREAVVRFKKNLLITLLNRCELDERISRKRLDLAAI